jgi:hypothetical protein
MKKKDEPIQATAETTCSQRTAKLSHSQAMAYSYIGLFPFFFFPTRECEEKNERREGAGGRRQDI